MGLNMGTNETCRMQIENCWYSFATDNCYKGEGDGEGEGG